MKKTDKHKGKNSSKSGKSNKSSNTGNKSRSGASNKVKSKLKSKWRELPSDGGMRGKSLKKCKEGIMIRKKDGYGFVVLDSAAQDRSDIYVPERFMQNSMSGDRVLVEIKPPRAGVKSPEGKVIKILEHSVKEVAGYVYRHNGKNWIEAIQKDGFDRIMIKNKSMKGAKTGDAVLVEISRYAEGHFPAEGVVREIIAKKGEAGSDIKCIAAAHGFKSEFPKSVLKEVEELRIFALSGDFHSDAVIDKSSNRRDIRSRLLFTIDGADSKDFDDAVSISRLKNGNYLLGVHIADVSHYVRKGSAIYAEAKKRANSVYLINQVIPMLPPALSDGLCSLNPHVDRLALSVDMEINCNGEILGFDIYESLINSSARLVYSDVSDFLEGLKNSCSADDVDQALLLMRELYEILSESSKRRGSLDFDLPESNIILDHSGRVSSIEKAERRIANRLIEEFMIAANRAVGERFCKANIPFIYRIHEKPEFQKMEEFKGFVRNIGYPLAGQANDMKPIALLNLLNQVKGTVYEAVVSSMMLRSMTKAYYGSECLGHFGLSLKYYSHFTSPIRRFPDLFIHGMIKQSLREGDYKSVISAANKTEAELVSEIASLREQKTLELEREVKRYKMVEYMSQFIGEEFSGLISGVTQFGIFVQLENTVEGLVALEDISDDYYIFQQDQSRLVGEMTSKSFSLGDPVQVRLISANIETREINFILAG